LWYVAAVVVARHLSIHGHVQGVWFRGWAVDTARSLGLTGWVRNRRDGKVEAWVQGEEARVARFIALAHEGPPGAQVMRVEVAQKEPDEGLAGFSQATTV
jgi:acylphosphatase